MSRHREGLQNTRLKPSHHPRGAMGNHKVLGKGTLPRHPIIMKDKLFSRRAEGMKGVGDPHPTAWHTPSSYPKFKFLLLFILLHLLHFTNVSIFRLEPYPLAFSVLQNPSFSTRESFHHYSSGSREKCREDVTLIRLSQVLGEKVKQHWKMGKIANKDKAFAFQ